MKRKRRPYLPILFFMLLASCCVAVFILIPLGMSIPRRAAQVFGSPKAGMGYPQLLYHASLLLLQQDDLIAPANPFGEEQSFKIELGEPTSQITRRLHLAGLIKNPDAFVLYLQYSGLDTSIQAGAYDLSPQMTALEIAQRLQDATPEMITFHILAGWRLEEGVFNRRALAASRISGQ